MSSSSRLVPSGLNNEFFARACESWRCRLGEGEFTHDNQVKLKVEAEKERTKLDPWKVKHERRVKDIISLFAGVSLCMTM